MSRKAKREEPQTDPNANIHYAVMGVALLLAGVTWWTTRELPHPPKIPPPKVEAGKTMRLPITLVTADKWDLACASTQEVEGLHCEFKDRKTVWPGLNPKDPKDRKKMLAPYMTVNNVLFLVAGLFEDPAVDERYRDEIPRGRDRSKLQRFTAECKFKPVKKIDNVWVRWNRKGDWQGPKSAWIGTVSNCEIEEP